MKIFDTEFFAMTYDSASARSPGLCYKTTALFGITLLLAGLAISARFYIIGFEVDENQCESTYMTPQYFPLEEASTGFPKYNLYLYTEQSFSAAQITVHD